MILTPSIFEGELAIGQNFSPSVEKNVEWFIKKYEPMYCHAVIGEKLYDELLDNLTPDPSPQESGDWDTLKDKLAYSCACFVYFHYMMNMITGTMGAGEFATNAENSERVSPWPKMVRRWNEMVDETPGIMKWIENNSDMYPEYSPDMKLYVAYGISRHENLWGL